LGLAEPFCLTSKDDRGPSAGFAFVSFCGCELLERLKISSRCNLPSMGGGIGNDMLWRFVQHYSVQHSRLLPNAHCSAGCRQRRGSKGGGELEA
jgi:hypothetical protein